MEKNRQTVYSPDGQVAFAFSCDGGKPTYRVTYKGEAVYDTAPLGHRIGGIDYHEGVSLREVATDKKAVELPLFGRMKTVRTAFNEAVFCLEAAGVPFTLEARVYNEGVAFRMAYDAAAGKTVNAEYTAFKVPEDSFAYASFGCRGRGCQRYERFAHYAAICYEAAYDRFPVKDIFMPTEKQDLFHSLRDGAADAERYILTPMAVEFPEKDGEKRFGAILEGYVRHYVGVNLRQKGSGLFELNTTYQSGKQFVDFDVTGDRVVTPYRILSVADSLDALYNNPILYSVNPPAVGDYDWVEPGRSAWSWRSNGSFTGKIDTMYAYSDAAIKMGFEYNILDGRWSLFAEDVPTVFGLVQQLCDDTRPYDVKQIVWNGFTASEARFPLGHKAEELQNGVRRYFPDYAAVETFFTDIEKLGIKGVKIDFMPPEDQVEAGVDLYEWVAKAAEKHHFIVNFHGAMKPSGLNITYPHVLNYEGIFGHEMASAREAENETHLFTTQYLTRGLAGHADFTPQVQNAYGWAELVFVDAPFNAIDATPAELTESPAVEFIKACPTVWDRTKVLSCSEYGVFAAMAREKDGSWFLGVINHNRAENMDIALSEFLGEGTYLMELYTDEGVSRRTVTAKDVLSVALSDNSGYAARISKVCLSQYGGVCGAPVAVTLAEDTLSARYTLDGSDPLTSKTAQPYTAPIAVSDTCRLRVAVTDRTGAPVACLAYRFNKLTADGVWEDAVAYMKGKDFKEQDINLRWLAYRKNK